MQANCNAMIADLMSPLADSTMMSTTSFEGFWCDGADEVEATRVSRALTALRMIVVAIGLNL